MGYDNNAFDVVLLFNIMHVNIILKEAYWLLKPNGYLVTGTDCYNETVQFSTKKKLILLKILKIFKVISYMSFYKKDEVITLLKNNNFKKIYNDILHK